MTEDESIAAIRILLGHRAKPGRANRNGETPLHLAARSHDRAGGVSALLDAGADPNRTDHRGDTPLHAALGPHRGVSGVVGALLDGGANPKAVNADGLTPLLQFVRHGPDRGHTVTLLLDAGADPDRKDPGGEAPLHIAIRTGGSRSKVDVAEALLAGGADPCVRDAEGFIPYSAAPEGGPIHQALDHAGGHDRACDRRGEAVALDASQRRHIQATLAAAGFDPGPADGKFGPRTRRAIEAWQQASGYVVTGDLTNEQVETLLTESAADIALTPKCGGVAFSGGWFSDPGCWMEIADKPGCHVLAYLDQGCKPGMTATWSGPCSGGCPSGQGELVFTGEGFWAKETGSFLDGRRHGMWTIRDSEGLAKGPYVGGKMNGHWFIRDHSTGEFEGPFVDGKMHGHFVFRFADGSVGEGAYVDDKMHGYHVTRHARRAGDGKPLRQRQL